MAGAVDRARSAGDDDWRPSTDAPKAPELDDFGLPISTYQSPKSKVPAADKSKKETSSESRTEIRRAAAKEDAPESKQEESAAPNPDVAAVSPPKGEVEEGEDSDSDAEEFKDAVSYPVNGTHVSGEAEGEAQPAENEDHETPAEQVETAKQADDGAKEVGKDALPRPAGQPSDEDDGGADTPLATPTAAPTALPLETESSGPAAAAAEGTKSRPQSMAKRDSYNKRQSAIHHSRDTSSTGPNALSEFSHQQLTAQPEDEDADEDSGWQVMPAFAPYKIYNDDNKLVAEEHVEAEEENDGYAGLGGAGKGYTRVLLDDDADSTTSMDENTSYLFKDVQTTSMLEDDDQHQRDAVSQLQETKTLLTEGQRIAYVGLTRLELSAMLKEAETLPQDIKKTKKAVRTMAESVKMWSQKMMVRLYSHMDISSAEQLMIEQLSDHGVEPKDLRGLLMANARVKNPMAEEKLEEEGEGEKGGGEKGEGEGEKGEGEKGEGEKEEGEKEEGEKEEVEKEEEKQEEKQEGRERKEGQSPRGSSSSDAESDTEKAADAPPAYELTEAEAMPAVRTPSQLPTTEKIDIDIRWTVLCDLFLVLIADSVYDARSRVLLERLGQDMELSPLDICRFEKKVTEALEMQQNAEKENWDEAEHMEKRRKMALRHRYMLMGLCTVGGGLVIGLSAGLLAPMIGAGLAAGFTTIGVTGTSGFLAGAGGAAIITSGAAASGGIIGIKAANRRTGAVRTFEYRPLHNNKRVNLIVTVSGWMTGKVDDVRLPYSTVDSVMGDIYSVLWEPEMLTSMGDTINILATEALTQGLQQLLGSTILVGLMAALQLPVVLTKLAYLIDNPWAVSLDRATASGLILADSLMDRNLGTRPITLVGYSLGSRVIFSCLQELGRRGAYGLVQNVYMFGSPLVVKTEEFMLARTVVAGRFVNGFNRNDWILGYLFRLTNGGIRRVAGLAAIPHIPQLENMDLTDEVVGHMDYRTAMPRLLRKCGWLVNSDEFTEIEDPDPANHQSRQRELINEIEEVRKELENPDRSVKGKLAGFFGRRKKAAKRQAWEVYEGEQPNPAGVGAATAAAATAGTGTASPPVGGSKTEDGKDNNHGVLFDVDAIRAELAKEHKLQDEDLAMEQLQIRELESTLPPMKLDLTPQTSPNLAPPAPTTTRSSRDSTRDEQLESGGLHPHSRRASRDYRQSDEQSRTPTSSRPRSVSSRNASVSHVPYYSSSPHRPNGNALATGGGDDYGHGEIQMTFDTPPLDAHSSHDGYRPAGPTKQSTFTSATSLGATASGEPRPEMLRSAQTVPNITLADPWAAAEEEDDPDFGKEREIELSFA